MRRLSPDFFGTAPLLPYSRVTADDRELSGDLFVAIRGARFDGHAALPRLPGSAIRGVIGEAAPLADYPLPYYRVSDSRRALALLAQGFAGDPARALRIAGVTGTNGKSTTVRLLAAILEAAGRRTGWMSTVTCRLGGDESTQNLTTLEPRELAAGMRKLLRAGGQDLVLEVSSHALVQERVAGIEFAGAVLTNLSRDHLDYHGTMEEYLRAKLRLFARSAPQAPVVFAARGPVAASCDEARGRRALSFGASAPADAFPVEMAFEATGLRGSISVLGERIAIESPLVGRHNLENILAAALLARALGADPGAIARGIASAPPVRGRLELVPGNRGRIYIDYAHTPDALAAVLAAARELTRGRLRVVFGCGGDRDRGKRPQMAAVAARLADVIYVTSDNPRSEPPGAIIDDILAGFPASTAVVVEENRRAAIARAVRDTAPADVLIVAGKGHEQEQIIGQARRPFDDREAVLSAVAIGTRL
ncbi:MAG: UDP-N-acetylmuramoyl-L-alanyl-D-glutamate--2,6-diaminopimelate ligase [Planctomycetes bacterium]|nr:UDP-N-acetylmuramoyl-L-alanyl-D-glutamate--2,6-diaminopimelate ligase [Planctomycetota bacterium]